MKLLKKIKKKIKGIWLIINSRESQITFLFSEEQVLRARIGKAIIKSWRGPTNAEEEAFFNKMIENISSAVVNEKNSSVVDLANECFGLNFSQGYWFYSFLCGFVCTWEMRVRSLAVVYNVRVKKQPNEKTAKEKKMNVIVNREMSEIINEIQISSKNNLKLNLGHLATLRGALIHGNFQQLRRYANYSGKKIKEKHKGNVLTFSLHDHKNIDNLSDPMDEEKMEEQQLFGWFIEGTNSQLLRDIFLEFEKSFKQINTIIDFKAYSFGERQYLFEKVNNGYMLTSKEEENFLNYFESVKVPNPNFFKKLYPCFIKLSKTAGPET